MEDYPKFLKGLALAALASVLLYGSALAVPSPSYPSPGSDAALTSATPAATHSATGARILFRANDRPLARGTFRSGGGSLAGNAVSIGTGSSRSKARYMLSGMVLAALTPLAIHHFGEPGDKSVAVQTQTPGSSSLANLGDAITSGNGHGRGGDKGGGGDKGNGGGGDGKDCNNDEGDNGGDNGDDDGGVVCDTGDHGDNGGSGGSGDNGGDCDNGGDHDSGGGGGDHGGGGTSLPEPGTVPLVGAGLMMALAFRSRRAR
jgi:hypothetical protein